MKKLISLAMLAAMVFSVACKSNQNKEQAAVNADSVLMLAKTVLQPLPAEAPNPANAVTPEKVLLGKTLYYDNRLSKNNTESCNTCHNIATYGVDNKPTSPGDNGKPGTRNSPTTFNAALHFVPVSYTHLDVYKRQIIARLQVVHSNSDVGTTVNRAWIQFEAVRNCRNSKCLLQSIRNTTSINSIRFVIVSSSLNETR